MSTSKKITKVVVSTEQPEGDGARVRRSIGTHQLRNLDPFLMLDEFSVRKPAGFPDHPHRGFETVTYMLEGTVAHEDFAGHRGRIGPGDLQWMTAGRGIVHAEMPDGNTAAKGLQLWVNLPKSAKMVPPKYQELLDKDVPKVSSQDGGVRVKVIAGESMGVKAKVSTYIPIYYLDFDMDANKSVEQAIPEDYTGFIYTLSGSALFGSEGTKGEPHSTLVLSRGGSTIRVETKDQSARFVLIAGKPIGEPIVQHGPFVMNDSREIYQAMLDYQMGQNGFENAAGWESTIARRYRDL
ncbi:RmlC-like cupin domain-containing protein [Polychytrium aggregatum]|uniref:RmlC-like cupin domain-containing protein n=1 Tax=Polychytrium aggregatum TaxID=110093 RepID=UPI0022FE8363|nr:RmlC-like cupin domain-containing protein [Polychytrium aggregatum]KAI9199268.1 RmlC-like cupin domain-containing protein [Polychytrium aggregatum]